MDLHLSSMGRSEGAVVILGAATVTGAMRTATQPPCMTTDSRAGSSIRRGMAIRAGAPAACTSFGSTSNLSMPAMQRVAGTCEHGFPKTVRQQLLVIAFKNPAACSVHTSTLTHVIAFAGHLRCLLRSC